MRRAGSRCDHMGRWKQRSRSKTSSWQFDLVSKAADNLIHNHVRQVSFYKPDALVVVADALRPGDEVLYHPGEINVRCADYFIINKVSQISSKFVFVEYGSENLHSFLQCSPFFTVY